MRQRIYSLEVMAEDREPPSNPLRREIKRLRAPTTPRRRVILRGSSPAWLPIRYRQHNAPSFIWSDSYVRPRLSLPWLCPAGAHLTDLQPSWPRIHDMRHTFATVAVVNGQGLPMIGKLLGHSQVQTTARYAHLAADPVKYAANAVSTQIAASLQWPPPSSPCDNAT
jgi:integrase